MIVVHRCVHLRGVRTGVPRGLPEAESPEHHANRCHPDKHLPARAVQIFETGRLHFYHCFCTSRVPRSYQPSLVRPAMARRIAGAPVSGSTSAMRTWYEPEARSRGMCTGSSTTESPGNQLLTSAGI